MKIELEDILWVDEVLQGKTESFSHIVDKYKDKVFSLAMGMLRQKEDAEEASQDVFIKIFKALSKFQRKAKFSTWMYRIAYNECISRLRKNKVPMVSVENTFVQGLLPVEDNGEDWQEVEERSKLLHKALNKLLEADRALVHFFYFESLSVDDIARITEFSVSNVKIKLFRIRKKLHKEMVPTNNNVLINE